MFLAQLIPINPGVIYLSALRTVPQIEIYFGKFLAKNVWRPLVNIPVADRDIITDKQIIRLPSGNHRVMPTGNQKHTDEEIMSVGYYPVGGGNGNPKPRHNTDALRVQVHWMEEKGSDVNLATHLINDAWAGRFEAAAVLSNDSDLIEPIRIVTQELKKPVILLCPVDSAHVGLKNASSSVRHIKRSDLKSSLFPDTLPGTNIVKPSTW
jgi:hypothetical protein